MIIVEGPDGSGKSTLIRNLNHVRRHLRALRGGRGADGAKKEGWGGNKPAVTAYVDKLLEAKAEESPACIGGQGTEYIPWEIAFDRFHLSEMVYGPMLRGTQELQGSDIVRLNDVIRSMHIPVILCLPPLALTIENVYKQDRHVPDYQTKRFLEDAYAEFQRLTPWATIVYDFTRDTLPSVTTAATTANQRSVNAG